METMIKVLEQVAPNGIPKHRYTEFVYLVKMLDRMGESERPVSGKFTVQQAAAAAGCHLSTVYAFIKAGKLKPERVGNRWMFTEADVHVLKTERQR